LRWYVVLMLLPGCIWISEADLLDFNDRDGDGLIFKQDCDDTNGKVKEELEYFPDVDGDGFGDANAQASTWCEGRQDQGFVTDNSDCDDSVAEVNITGTELCDATDKDENCNGFADDLDDDAEGKITYYPDADGDGYGDIGATGEAFCDPPSGYVTDNTDCDDDALAIHPAAEEVCDDLDADEDCNGVADDADQGIAELPIWYLDDDGDGFGDIDDTSPLEQCEQPSGYVSDNTDCDDLASAVNPGLVETCDPADVDEDCDGLADNDDPAALDQTDFYPDTDGDGYGDAYAQAVSQCDAAPGLVEDFTDCDDGNVLINPGAAEICDPLDADENCNGQSGDPDVTLDLATQTDWYPDVDGDGFGDLSAFPDTSCDAPSGWVADNTDCDDTLPDGADIHPDVLDRPGDGDMNCDTFDYICGESMVRVYPVANPDADFTSIQAAVDDVLNDPVTFPGSLCDGDIIQVTPGTYSENLQILDVSPVIRGVVGPAVTIIDGGGLGRTVNMERMSATLEGFTIRGGDAASEVLKEGGGIRMFYGYPGATLRNLVVDGNAASVAGGIDINNPEDVLLADIEITDNTATVAPGQNAGGLRVKAVGGAGGGTVTLDNLFVDGNQAGNQDGGVRIAMSLSMTTVVIQDSEITNNLAFDGGGLGVRTAHRLEVYDSDISNNDGLAQNGGAFLESTHALFDGVTFDGNTTGGTLSALWAQELTGDLELVECAFTNNVVNANGYAVLVKGSSTYGGVLNDVVVARNYGHMAASFGSGIALEGFSDVTNALIYDNTGPWGGMMLTNEQVGGPVPALHKVVNSTFVGNEADGLNIVASTAVGITVKNVTSSDNGGFGITNAMVPPTISYTNVFNNASGGYNGVDQVGINGNTDADPLFVNDTGDSVTWDLHLDVASTLIDAGDPDSSFDDVDGSQCDIGYYGGPGGPP